MPRSCLQGLTRLVGFGKRRHSCKWALFFGVGLLPVSLAWLAATGMGTLRLCRRHPLPTPLPAHPQFLQTVLRTANPVTTFNNTAPTYWLVTQTRTPPAAATPPAPGCSRHGAPSQLAILPPARQISKHKLPTYFTVPGHRTRLQGPDSNGTAISLMPHRAPASHPPSSSTNEQTCCLRTSMCRVTGPDRSHTTTWHSDLTHAAPCPRRPHPQGR